MSTSRIVQLSSLIANQIAAGEVVERPASVVKELLENSIDSGADKIEVEIEGGGMHLIRVRDNGHGIIKSDLILAFSRHATSKIRTQADLEAITSMGFRGEALASIASVSRCRLISQVQNQESAWQIQFTPDLSPTLQPAAHPVGTTVDVLDLFYNTPVRRKFLRSEKTEFQAIEEVVKRQALAFPHVTISLKHQQKLVRLYPGVAKGGNEIARLSKICGQLFAKCAAQISMQAGTLSLHGWLGLPSIARRVADCQYFFVNQRIIKDRLLNHVIKTIYLQHPDMIEGSYPCYVLYLTCDPIEVDVNVHPTKQEVRFANARLVHDFMSKCIRETLNEIANPQPIDSATPFTAKGPSKRYFQSNESQDFLSSKAFYEAAIPYEMPEKLLIRSERFAIIEEKMSLVFLDLEKAKAALLAFYYEKNDGDIPTKTLLFPLRFVLSKRFPNQNNIVNHLQKFGFGLRIENREVVLLQQPEIIHQPWNEHKMEALISAAWFSKEAILPALIDQIDCDFANTPLILEWIALNQKGPWIRLTHLEMAKMIKAKEDSLSMTLAPL